MTKKKQTNELLNAIEMSFYNRVYIDADMDELEKINIQLNELEEFRDTHQITFADKELKEEYENIIDILIDQADLYDQINLEISSLKESSDLEVYEELIINYCKSMYELSESAVCLIDDYEMCSDNPELVERSRTNKSIFFAYAQMWQYINDISQEDRKKIFDDEGIEFENKCEYDIELYVYPRDLEDLSLLLDSFEMTIESGEKVTLSKSIESRTMGSNSFIQMYIVLKNPRG